MKTTLPVIIAFLSGLAMVFAFILSPGKSGDIEGELLRWVSIIGGFTLLLGVISIVRVNLRPVLRRESGWYNKLALLLAVAVTGIPAILPVSWSSKFGTGDNSIYDWFFNNLNAPMMATMFALLAFYIASAAFRAFRARNAEATLLLITAVLVMLWRVPFGEFMFSAIHEELPQLINNYIMGGINVSVQRGIIIGSAMGAATMGLRIMLGIERTYMGGSK